MVHNQFPGWDKTDPFPLSPSETDQAFLAVMEKAARIEKMMERSERRRRLSPLRNLVIAAALIAAVVIPTLFLRPGRSTGEKGAVAVPVEMIQKSTRRGEIAEVVLPDSSRVVLNSESTLIYPDRFLDGERSVFLSGEAVFDVRASDQEPFFVKTQDITVRVHGTRFDVKAYFDDPSVYATLCRGAITAWPNGSSERKVELVPNQEFNYCRATGAITTEKVSSLEAVSWENGDLCFRRASIESIIRVAQRRFDVSIYLTSGKYANASITARFIHGETLEDLLDALCAIVPGLHYMREGNNIYLK